MTTAMAAPQDSIHDRLQPPEDPVYPAWTEQPTDQDDHHQESPYYSMPKRNKRKNFKPRCAPNTTAFSDDSNQDKRENSPENDRDSPEDRNGSEESYKIGVKNFSLLKGAVDLSRRLSTDSNDNEGFKEKKIESFQRSYIDSLQIDREREQEQTVLNFSNFPNSKSFCAKNPFAISQLIKTNSPPRRRESECSEEVEDAKSSQDINANDRLGNAEAMEEDGQQNGDPSNANKMLREYAMNTMKEFLGFYGLSSNEMADVISGQPRTLEALQGKPFSQLALGMKRRHSSEVRPSAAERRRHSSATDEEASTNITPPKTPDETDQNRQRAIQLLSAQSMRLFGRGGGSAFETGTGARDEDSSGSDDGDHTLDLSLSRDADMQEMSRGSSAGGSGADWEQIRRNLEELAPLQLYPASSGQSLSDQRQDDHMNTSGLISALNQLEQARKNAASSAPVDYSRYVKRYGSSLECGSSYCKDLGYREHFHCMDCSGKIFCKKEEMIRHFKWHKKRDESLSHGFMRYSPLDDCSERYGDCPHNRSQTHYHCIQDSCDKVYISTSDVQMHANYHRKDSAILQEGFQRFRATETCSASHCAFQGQRTTHFHCRRPGCTYTFKNKADMEKHKTYHIKDEALARDGFKKYMKSEPCPYRECRFSRTCNHIHCIRPRCNYVLHSSSQIFTHKRKHERKEQEMGFGLPTSVIQSAFLQQSAELSYSPSGSSHAEDDGSSLSAFMMEGEGYPNTFSQLVMEEVSRKYIESFSGGKDSEDKCGKCSAFNRHYHCLAEGCSMAHSCQTTMMKHALEHEAQAQVTEAFYVTYSKNNPCPASACRHLREVTHSHCTWENCGAVVLASEDQPFKRLEHHRQHAMPSPLSPNLASRLAPNLASQLSAQLHPNVVAQLGQGVSNLPPNLAQLAQMAPNLTTPNLQAQLGLGPSPVVLPTPNIPMVNTSSSLDEMFSRKRGRPPKNRVVEVWTDNVNVTPQAIFTSFKLPKSNQLPTLPPSPIIGNVEEFSNIKFQNFTVFTVPDSCSQSYSNCPLKMTRIHLHCAHCSFSGETHIILETHARETHSIIQLLEGFDYYMNFDQCGGKSCFKNQLRSHFHCAQASNCPAILTQYSVLITHKHGRGTPVARSDDLENRDEARDYSTKERDSDSVGSSKNESGELYAANFSMKNEPFEKDADGALNVSVVKATGTFYPSSHLKSNASSPSPRSLCDTSPCKDLKSLRIDFPKSEVTKTSGPTIPPSCHDQLCPLNKSSGPMNLHYHCPHCSQAYVDLKLLFGHMVKKHSNTMDSGTMGLAATKETLEREYPEISILPSTATSSGVNQVSPTQRHHNPVHSSEQDQYLRSYNGSNTINMDCPHRNRTKSQVQAVQSLLLQQYLSGGGVGGVGGVPGVGGVGGVGVVGGVGGRKALGLQDQLKLQQQYTASLAALPPHLQMALFSQGGSPFPLYAPMMYPPELLLETGLLQHAQLQPDKDTDMMLKKAHGARGPHMRVLKDEPIPEGYLRFRFNEDCAYQHCGYREHQTHFHCTRKDCGYSFCDKTRFVQHTARHERLDTLMGGDFQQYRANVFCNRPDCVHATNFGTGQNKASHFHCLKCEFVCTDTNKVVAHRRQHQKMDSIQAAGFDKFPPSKGCGFEPQCIHSKKQTHYHCLQCGFAVLGLSQMTSHKYKHQEAGVGPSTSAGN